MTRLVLIASWTLLIGFVAANSGSNDAQAVAYAESDASPSDQNTEGDNSEGCEEPDTTTITEAPVTTTKGPKLECGPNEVYDDCPADCPTDRCAKNEAEAQSSKFCPRPDNCPPPQCKCQFNYRRAENGTCIPTTDCPAFECSGENEEYNSCPPLCPSDDCSQASPSGECPKLFGNILIILECAPKCRCRKGYWRKNGVCVPYAECNKECDVNEEYVLEKPTCPPQECFSIVAKFDCRKAPPPQPGCACKSGFMRLNSTSPCIPTCQCPEMRHSPDCEGKTESE